MSNATFNSPRLPSVVNLMGTPPIHVSEDGSITRGRVGTDTSQRSFTVLKTLYNGSFSMVSLCDWHSPDIFRNVPLSAMEREPGRRPTINGTSYQRLAVVKQIRHRFLASEAENAFRFADAKVLKMGLPPHPNVVTHYDLFLDLTDPTGGELYTVMEPMEGNLYHLIKARRGKPFAAGLVMSIVHQLASGIHHVHTSGYMHRDIIPENILVTTTGHHEYDTPWPRGSRPDAGVHKDITLVLKVADFSLARKQGSPGPYTEYVTIRWYRAPEVLLLSNRYTAAIDNWAFGAILAELVNLAPFFPGTDQMDQVSRLVQKLGNPVAGEVALDEYGQPISGSSWPEGVALAEAVGFRFPSVTPTRFSSFFEPEVSPLLLDCIKGLLTWNPAQRWTARMCLEHEFLKPYLDAIEIVVPDVNE